MPQRKTCCLTDRSIRDRDRANGWHDMMDTTKKRQNGWTHVPTHRIPNKETYNRTPQNIMATTENNTHAPLTADEKLKVEERIVDVLKTVYDPEIPVNIYDLGLIYKIDLQDDGTLDIDMTFTAPSCPAADFILEDVRTKVEAVQGVTSATINMVFEPEWDKSMMTEEARVELGFE